MRALSSTSKISTRSQARVHRTNNAHRPPQATLNTRTQTTPPAAWPQVQRATYYYDAAHQSALTLRTLLKNVDAPAVKLGTASNADLTVNAVHRLLASLCPREDDDSERHAYFSELMSMHLSELNARELQTLKSVLKNAGFSGVLSSSVVDEARHREWDFSKGSLQPKERTPMLPEELYRLLDELAATAAAAEKLPLTGQPLNLGQASAARHCLVEAAEIWPQCGQTMSDFQNISTALAASLGLPDAVQMGTIAKLASRGSMLEWKDNCLVIDKQVFESLTSTDGHFVHDELLFNELLRDMLEMLLTRKLFGENINPWQLSANNKTKLRMAMDEVTAQAPSLPSEMLRSGAQQVLSQAGQMGKLQIMPSAGGALGHAWLGNDLSIVPDKTQKKQAIGTHFMRTALRLEPDDCTVKQWPVRWLSPEENDALHPQTYAWQITVPVEAKRLQESAKQVAKDWKAEALPFRFIGTSPEMRGTGCRVSVLRAIEQGMDPVAREMFKNFNAGLAEPDSPTEIANRMNQFMGWLKELAGS